jgi:hypothetical protein
MLIVQKHGDCRGVGASVLPDQHYYYCGSQWRLPKVTNIGAPNPAAGRALSLADVQPTFVL